MDLNSGDANALVQLVKAGSDLSKPHFFDYYLYFPNREDAEQVAMTLRNDGFQVTVSLGAYYANWLCLARKIIIPSYEAISNLSAYFETLVSSKNGDYDGWETAVVN